jgi:hypothetical protein
VIFERAQQKLCGSRRVFRRNGVQPRLQLRDVSLGNRRNRGANVGRYFVGSSLLTPACLMPVGHYLCLL